MYSHKYKLILLNNRKCGSSSFRKVLQKNIKDIKDIQNNGPKTMDRFEYNSNNCHINASKCIQYFFQKNINISDYYIITTIRDPVKKAISAYNYYKPDNNLKLCSNYGYNSKKKYYYDINEYILKGGFVGENILDFAYDKSGNKLVTHIFNIDDKKSINNFLKLIGLNCTFDEHCNKSKNNSISLNKDAIKYLRQTYNKDYELL